MPIEIQDYLSANLVLIGGSLLNSDNERSSFRQSMDAEIVFSDGTLPPDLPASLSSLQAVQTRKLQISRHRIEVEVIPSMRSIIKQEYPSEDMSILARTATFAIGSTREIGEITAHGYNIELVYDQTSEPRAVTYIANHVFAALPRVEGWRPTAGTAAIRFRDSTDNTWNVTIEPRFNDDNTRKIFFRLNLHFSGGPNPEDIDRCFRLVLDKAKEFVAVLDNDS